MLYGVWIGDHRCQFGTGTREQMQAMADKFNRGRRQNDYEVRPVDPRTINPDGSNVRRT